MTHTLITIPTDGKESRVFAKPELHRLQEAVGGTIQLIPGFKHPEFKRCEAYANDSGLIDGLPFNTKATAMWKEALKGHQLIYEPQLHGTIIVVVKGNHTLRTKP
jgi:hypothetical protein